MKKFLISALISFGTLLSTVGLSFADELLVPHYTYRVGPFAAIGTAVDRFKNATQRPPSQSDITLSILNSSNNMIAQIIYRDSIPTALTDIQFQATSGAESFLTFGASFRFTYFDIKIKNPTTGAITDSFDVIGSVTG